MATDDTMLSPINLGNPDVVTVREVAEIIIALTGSRSPVVFKPLPPDIPKQQKPDITLTRQKLGWSAKVAFRECSQAYTLGRA